MIAPQPHSATPFVVVLTTRYLPMTTSSDASHATRPQCRHTADRRKNVPFLYNTTTVVQYYYSTVTVFRELSPSAAGRLLRQNYDVNRGQHGHAKKKFFH